MASLAQLFGGANFRSTITRYCNQQGWKIANLTDKSATLRFSMDSGRSQTLFILKYDTTLEFSVPSVLQFSSMDAIPHYVSTILLKASSQGKIGFWCIEEIGGKETFSVMHNAELSLIDSDYFASVVRVLIRECDKFEGIILDMLR